MEEQIDFQQRMKNSLQFKMGNLHRLMTRRINMELGQHNIPVIAEQIPILMVIYLSAAQSQQEIANVLQRDKSGVQRAIQSLVKDGFLRIEGDPADKRKNLVVLTNGGRYICEKVKEIATGFNAQIRENFSEDEYHALLRLLDKLSEIIEKPLNG